MTIIASSAVRSCFGDGLQTFAGLVDGRCGVRPLTGAAAGTGVVAGYPIDAGNPTDPHRGDGWLIECVRQALEDAGIEPVRTTLRVIVGTGLGQQSVVEHWARDERPFDVEDLHYRTVLVNAIPGLMEVQTLHGACSAAGSALALGQDMIDLGRADIVVVAGVDAMTTSMLAMIGRIGDTPTTRVMPFDRSRTGVLLGEGACAVVLAGDEWSGPRLGRLLSTGLSCDAKHETAPDVAGIGRSMTDAYRRAGVRPSDVDLVVAHGTATALNDPAECAALLDLLGDAAARPVVTAVKGAVGHTSGGSALLSVDVALRAIRHSMVPPVVGLTNPLPEAGALRFAMSKSADGPVNVVQVDSFGFGGVNAVALVGAL